MAKSHATDKAEDLFHLNRFLVAPESIYHQGTSSAMTKIPIRISIGNIIILWIMIFPNSSTRRR